VEGFQAGADDYLVKPFTARELLARVATHVRMSRLRRETVTDQVLARKAVEISEERLRLAQIAAQIGTWEWDPIHNTSTLSPQLHKMFGTDANDPDHSSKWAARIHPDDLPRVQDLLRASRDSGTMDFEYRYLHPEAGLRWFHCKGRRLREDSRMLGVILDITARKQAEEARYRLAAIVESSDDAIVSKDLNGIVSSWNKSAERLFGYKAEEIIGRSITLIIPPELQQDEEMILSKIRRGEKIDHFQTVRLSRSGQRIDVSLTISPVRDEHGNVIGAAKIARDITLQKQAEQTLRMTERLASVGRLAATVAHEINNPLEAVTNFIYLAKNKAAQEDVRAYLAGAEEELERVAHLTKQTLGFYRDTKGAAPTGVATLLNPLLSVFAARIRNKQITVRTQVADDAEIVAVPGEISQLLAHLLSNSIDAVAMNSQITLRVRTVSDFKTPRRRWARITIADSGCGIPAEHRPRLFEPFFTTKKDIGIGLGLWICKNIVEKQGGTIRVRSSATPGKSGTVFCVLLPVKEERSALAQEVRLAV
jgi:PAS domain S-box-containing protein